MRKSPHSVGCIVLAGGGSSRFGSPKQLLMHEGEPLVKRAARVALDAGFAPVIVVLGARAASIEPALGGLPSISIVVNDEWESGQSSSLREGIERAIELDCDAAIVLLADQPLVDSSSLADIGRLFDEEHRVIASSYAGIVGVPALFGSEFFDELTQLSGDEGAGKWLRRHSHLVTTVPMEQAAVDIDIPEDAAKLRPR